MMSLSFLRVLGPGLLFAGSAIGVSHLVQSTRAGALYGLGLVVFIILAHLAKYPGFLFAPRYSAVTGLSILDSYRRQGSWVLVFYAIATLLTMFIAAAANLLVTVGLVQVTVGMDIGVMPVAIALSIAGMSLLIIGHYHWLELIIKALVVLLTIATLVTTVLVVPLIDWDFSGQWLPNEFDIATIIFIAALIGWMPTPFDVSVWQSLWTIAKMKDSHHQTTLKESKLDFDVGYMMTLVLAICFVILGTAALHGSGQQFESSSALFAGQIMDVYRVALGDWSAYFVGIAAIGVMFSTWLTILDGWPRGLACLVQVVQSKETFDEIEDVDSSSNFSLESDAVEDVETTENKFYWPMMVIMVFGALVILQFFMSSFKGLIDLAATVSFLTAPIYAFLNHRAMIGKEVPEEARPSKKMQCWSLAGILALTAFAMVYLYIKAIS